MRAVTEYVTRDGRHRFRVKFREGKGRNARTSSLTFPSLAQGERFAKELDVLGWAEAVQRAEERAGKVSTLSVDEYAIKHIDTLSGITAGTRTTYKRIYTKTWAPVIGSLPLEDVSRQDIAGVVTRLSESGKSDKTVKNEYTVIAAIFNAAVIDDKISRSPCRGVKLPRVTEQERAEMQIIDHEEFAILIAEIPEHYVPLVTTLVGTGIRWGEAEGLQVRDLSLDAEVPTLHVRRAAKWNSGMARQEIGPPKTKKGRRDVELAPEVVDVLRPLIVGKGPTDQVFTAPGGGQLRHRTFWSDIWRPALFRASLCPEHRGEGCKCGTAKPSRCQVHETPPAPCGCDGTLSKPLRIHDLRHTAVSWMLAANIPLYVVSRIIGHESTKTTADIYAHLMPEGRRAVAQVMSGMLAAGRQ